MFTVFSQAHGQCVVRSLPLLVRRGLSVSQDHIGRIGFIGLGNMGLPMSINLARNGLQVMGFDTSASRIEALVSAGGIDGGSVGDIARACDTIITMLPSNAAVQAVYAELRAEAADLCLYIDSSTIDPGVAKAVARDVVESGGAFLDAPVSGGAFVGFPFYVMAMALLAVIAMTLVPTFRSRRGHGWHVDFHVRWWRGRPGACPRLSSAHGMFYYMASKAVFELYYQRVH